MMDFFAGLYEWWSLLPFYSTNFADHLRGYDITCTNYNGRPIYTIVGAFMILSTLIIYGIQYHGIDSPRWIKRKYWWITALFIVILNFIIAFVIPFISINAGDYCKQLKITSLDCIGFGFSNAIWSLILYTIITSVPWIRAFSTNSRHTTFWKP
jgi:hypothetical protein